MKKTDELTVKLKISARYALAFVALSLIIWRPALLESASMTMTSYYPAPYGGYNQLLSTGNTLLGDSSSFAGVVGTAGAANTAVHLGRNGGRVCVGSSNSGAGMCRRASGSGAKGALHVYGDAFFGYPNDGTNAYNSTFSGVFDVGGETRLSRAMGLVKIGDLFAGDPYNTTTLGVVSNIPFGTNKWIYVGANGSLNTYNNPSQRGYASSGRFGVLVDAGAGDASTGGVGVFSTTYTAGLTVSGSNAVIGGKVNTGLYLTAGGNNGIFLSNAAPPAMTVYGPATFNEDVTFKKNISLNNVAAGAVNTTVSGLCYQKLYGVTDTSSCSSGYVLIGFVPNDGIGGRDNNANARGMYYVGSTNAYDSINAKSDVGYSNPHVLAAGWLTCCAMNVEVKG